MIAGPCALLRYDSAFFFCRINTIFSVPTPGRDAPRNARGRGEPVGAHVRGRSSSLARRTAVDTSGVFTLAGGSHGTCGTHRHSNWNKYTDTCLILSILTPRGNAIKKTQKTHGARRNSAQAQHGTARSHPPHFRTRDVEQPTPRYRNRTSMVDKTTTCIRRNTAHKPEPASKQIITFSRPSLVSKSEEQKKHAENLRI